MRTTIDLDERWPEAAAALGTSGKTATVNAALEAIIAQNRRREAIETFHALELDLNDDEVMEGAWR